MIRVTCVVWLSVIFFALLITYPSSTGCKQTKTTASGFAASQQICSGNLIFEENFEQLNKQKWKPEVTLWGGGVSICYNKRLDSR